MQVEVQLNCIRKKHEASPAYVHRTYHAKNAYRISVATIWLCPTSCSHCVARNGTIRSTKHVVVQGQNGDEEEMFLIERQRQYNSCSVTTCIGSSPSQFISLSHPPHIREALRPWRQCFYITFLYFRSNHDNEMCSEGRSNYTRLSPLREVKYK